MESHIPFGYELLLLDISLPYSLTIISLAPAFVFDCHFPFSFKIKVTKSCNSINVPDHFIFVLPLTFCKFRRSTSVFENIKTLALTSLLSSFRQFSSVLTVLPFTVPMCVYASQLVRYARCCSNYSDFLIRHRALVKRLLSQGYKVNRLSNTFKKFYGRHTDLVGQYKKNVCQMFADSIS